MTYRVDLVDYGQLVCRFVGDLWLDCLCWQLKRQVLNVGAYHPERTSRTRVILVAYARRFLYWSSGSLAWRKLATQRQEFSVAPFRRTRNLGDDCTDGSNIETNPRTRSWTLLLPPVTYGQ